LQQRDLGGAWEVGIQRQVRWNHEIGFCWFDVLRLSQQLPRSCSYPQMGGASPIPFASTRARGRQRSGSELGQGWGGGQAGLGGAVARSSMAAAAHGALELDRPSSHHLRRFGVPAGEAAEFSSRIGARISLGLLQIGDGVPDAAGVSLTVRVPRFHLDRAIDCIICSWWRKYRGEPTADIFLGKVSLPSFILDIIPSYYIQQEARVQLTHTTSLLTRFANLSQQCAATFASPFTKSSEK
jgi:hypothetical protein